MRYVIYRRRHLFILPPADLHPPACPMSNAMERLGRPVTLTQGENHLRAL
jgi:hypothetical protein